MIESNQRIEEALAQLGAEYEPPLGWEARVLAATRAHRPWWRYARPGFAVAALAVCAVALWPTAAPTELTLSVEVQHSAPVRGREGQVGDTVRISAMGRETVSARLSRPARPLRGRAFPRRGQRARTRDGSTGCRVGDWHS